MFSVISRTLRGELGNFVTRGENTKRLVKSWSHSKWEPPLGQGKKRLGKGWRLVRIEVAAYGVKSHPKVSEANVKRTYGKGELKEGAEVALTQQRR